MGNITITNIIFNSLILLLLLQTLHNFYINILSKTRINNVKFSLILQYFFKKIIIWNNYKNDYKNIDQAGVRVH